MIGMGTLMCLIAAWYWASLDLPAQACRESRWFLRVASATGVVSVITLEAGWVVSEVGRQPWIVYNLMKVEAAATANTGVWVTFLGVVVLYVGVGVTTILVLRGMSRRFRDQDERATTASTRPTRPTGRTSRSPRRPGSRPRPVRR